MFLQDNLIFLSEVMMTNPLNVIQSSALIRKNSDLPENIGLVRLKFVMENATTYFYGNKVKVL